MPKKNESKTPSSNDKDNEKKATELKTTTAGTEAALAAAQAIPLEDVDEPSGPMATLLQEASDLATYIEDPQVRSSLVAVGVEEGLVDALPDTIHVARTCQSSWTVTRDRSKSAAQKEREARGEAVRADLMASCRWNLRRDAGAQSTLDAIAEGEGIADLVQDLHDIAELIEKHPVAFASDRTFDAPARAEEARQLGSDIQAGLSSGKLVTNQEDAKVLRDRAATRLEQIVSTIRSAGRYAFRADPKRRARFASEMLRGKRRRAAQAKGGEVPPAPPAPPLP